MDDPTPRPGRVQPAVAGAAAAAVALAAAAVADAVWRPVPSLVGVVGQAVIRLSPGDASRAAIDAVGTADKPLLVAVTIAVALGFGACAGVAAASARWRGDVVFAALAAVAALAGWSLPGVSAAATAAAAVGSGLCGIVVLRLQLAAIVIDGRAALRHAGGRSPGDLLPGAGATRRRFLTASGLAAGTGAVGLLAARALKGREVAEAQREAIRLPAPADGAGVRAPDGLPVAGIAPLVTPNREFFRIDEALIPPSVDPRTWRLRVHGMVRSPLEFTFDELLGEPLVERHITLACVSNEVGGGLVGTARWLGVRLADLLERAGVEGRATQVVGRSVDGFTVGFPLEAAVDGRDSLVAVGMNGEPLPVRHGFPARLVVPGLYGYVSATKWLREIELTTWERFDAYWIERGWAERAPVKVQSRIDVPRRGSRVAAGEVAVAGVAWAPHRGVARVEVAVDGRRWTDAELGPPLGDDAWRQWVYRWNASPGHHTTAVRATTIDGEVQTAERVRPFPDGATGHHSVDVTVVD